ncbi:unnamed protein product [Callosobruchus maculatus]|uniref:Uncharacterized protein n=1 Tax=Callosobruchus maculatus TaxID=64391 RepID=A0A653DH22_CALMS|nr:unnamed protein product [Callosobruchus maculatus]
MPVIQVRRWSTPENSYATVHLKYPDTPLVFAREQLRHCSPKISRHATGICQRTVTSPLNLK